MHFFRTGITHHLHNLHRCRAAHNRVIYQDNPLALHNRAVGGMFHAHTQFTHGLCRLNEGAPDIVIADDAQFIRDTGCLRIAKGCRHAGVWHRDHDIRINACFMGELGAHGFAYVIDRTAMHDRVRAREIDIFKNAGTRGHFGEGLDGFNAVIGDDHHFAIFNIPHKTRADNIKRTGFGGENEMPVQLPQNQRANAQGITRTDQLFIGQTDKGIGPFELLQGIDETVGKFASAALRHQMQNHFRVAGRLIDRAAADQLTPQGQTIGQIAVMGNGKAAPRQFGEQRLHIAQNGFAGCGIAHMADGTFAFQAFDNSAVGKAIADKTQTALGMEPLSVKTHNACGFLSAMLQGMETKGCDGCRLGMAVNAKNPAFLAQPIRFEIEFAVKCD